jgi:hypothetical protein
MKRLLKALGWAMVILIGVALVASIAILIGANFYAEPNAAIVNVGEIEIEARGLFNQPILTILAAWFAVAGALVVATLAVIFTCVVSGLAVAFVLALTAMFFFGGAILIASPLLAIGVIVWLMIRSSRRADPPNDSATPPAVAA